MSADLNNYLRATVSYTDGHGGSKSAQADTANAVQAAPVTNSAPAFDSESVTLSVDENTGSEENVGSVVTATDADNDTLTYSLSGTDVASFGFDTSSGQITTSAALDYETKNSYSVTVEVTDGKNADGTDDTTTDDTITVTINVTNVDEAPTATDDTATAQQGTAVEINVVANDTDPDTGTTLSVTAVSMAPTSGTAEIKSGSTTTVIYTSNTGFNGEDSFGYTVSDGTTTATGTVKVLVYTPAPTPSSTQSTQGVPVGARTNAEAPTGRVTVEFPQGASTGSPFHVRVDDAPNQDCGNLPSGQIIVACSQLDLFKLDGTDWDAADGTPFTAADLIISVTSTQDISVYRRDDPSDSWTSIPGCAVGSTVECFTVSGGLVTIQNIRDFSQFAVLRPRPPSQVVPPTEMATPPPTPGGGGAATTTPRRRRGSIVQATATPAPTMVVMPTPTPTEMAVPATDTPKPTSVVSTTVPQTLPVPTVVQPTAAPPTPDSTVMPAISTPTFAPAPTDTPAAVSAIPNTPVPASTTAVPPAVETRGEFPAWLIVGIAAAIIISGGLLFSAWRLLRPQ